MALDDNVLDGFEKKGRGFVEETAPEALGRSELNLGGVISETASVLLPETPTLDQGAASSCLAVAMMDGLLIRAEVQGVVNARLFAPLWVYRFGRVDPSIDAGMSFARAIEAVEKLGLPADEHWPYSDRKVREAPPLDAEQHAFDQRGKVKLHLLANAREAQLAIAQGYPVVVGFRSLFRAPHAVLLVGFAPGDRGLMFRLKNQWGLGFGERGYTWVSAADVDDDNIGLCAVEWVPSPSEDAT